MADVRDQRWVNPAQAPTSRSKRSCETWSDTVLIQTTHQERKCICLFSQIETTASTKATATQATTTTTTTVSKHFQQLQHDDWKRDLQSESSTMVNHDVLPYLMNRLGVGDCHSPPQPLFDRGHLCPSHPSLTQTHTYTHVSISTPISTPTDRPQAIRWTFVRPFYLCHLLPPCRNIRTHRT